MDAEPRASDGRIPVRRLKDISHLYISTARRSAPAADRTPHAAPRRSLRLAIGGAVRTTSRVEFTANLALQLARLGRRTLVLELDPSLPNVGFRLALEPGAYLAHLVPEPRVRVERGLLGVRLVEGGAAVPAATGWPESVREELRSADCVLIAIPSPAAARAALRDLEALLPAAAPTTLGRAATQSPMIGAWLATAQRSTGASPAAEGALWIHEAANANGAPLAAPEELGDLPVRAVLWGTSEDPSGDPKAWARVPRHPRPRLPIAALEPEHPASRLYEGLAQSLLAAFAATGGGRA